MQGTEFPWQFLSHDMHSPCEIGCSIIIQLVL